MNQITTPASIATIEISNVCNAKCRWCTTGLQNRVCHQEARFMTPELLERGLNRLLEIGWITQDTKIELYNWGEPFLNPHLDSILEILLNKGFCFRLSTNGSVYKKLQPNVVKNIEYLMISLPGMSQESYDKIHQLNIETVHKNIEKFAEDLAECGASDKLILNFHVYQFNLNELDEARHLAGRLGGSFMRSVAYLNDYRLCQEYLTGQMERQDLYDATTDLFMNFYHPQNADADYKCGLWNQVCFDHEFNLVPCCRLTSEEKLGNLFSDDPQDLVRAREQLPACEECIASGQSSIILNAPQADWDNKVEALEQGLTQYKNHYLAAVSQREDLSRQLAEVQGAYVEVQDAYTGIQNAYAEVRNAYNVISNAAFWKMTKPLRVVLDFIKRLLRSNRYTWLFCKGLKCLRQNGVRYTWRKITDKLRHRHDFLALASRPLYTQEELDAQRAYAFPRAVKFSIVVPLYNTPQKFLHEMIQSVLDQTYEDWELCMADGSDGEHAYVGRICQEYARKDKRVIYRKLEANKGISENTNACIDIATGEYIGLLDHDDLLHPAALYDVMRAICEQDADFVYTDEVVFKSPNVNELLTAHFKPDFAIDNLRANNYICHFSVFQKTLLDSAGKFRPAYDGSQDHDMILRLTAQANRIVHIPKLLYYWRSHPQSVAMDISSKGYAATAGRNAVFDSVTQLGLSAEVDHSKAFPAIYRLKYAIRDSAKVSIIIAVESHTDDLKRCIDSILMRSTYKNYEIIVVDNRSGEMEDLSYFDALKADDRIKRFHPDRDCNHADLNEIGAAKATGEYLLFLHPDAEVITPEWIEEMLMYVQRDDVAAAGAMLYFPDDTIQHAGIVLSRSADHIAGNLCSNFPRGEIGYMGRLCYAQNMSAVSTACMMVKSHAYRKVGGFDRDFTGMYCAVDFCLKLRRAGYLIVWTPYAELYHYEPKNIEYLPLRGKQNKEETRRFKDRWNEVLEVGDPYYNPNFSLAREDFSVG